VLALGAVRDVLAEDPSELDSFVARWPATFLVGDAASVDALLAARAELASLLAPGGIVTLVDAVGLDALELPSLEGRLVEAALEDGGPLAVDRDGVARRLAGIAPRPALVRIAEGGRVLARAGYADLAGDELSSWLAQE